MWKIGAKPNHSFEDIAAYAAWEEVVTGHGEAERISTLRVSPSFFGIMDAPPLLGRTFAANENLNAKASVAVLSYGLWQRKFAKDPNILGQKFSMNSTVFTIIGVMPQDFRSLPSSLVKLPWNFTSRSQRIIWTKFVPVTICARLQIETWRDARERAGRDERDRAPAGAPVSGHNAGTRSPAGETAG